MTEENKRLQFFKSCDSVEDGIEHTEKFLDDLKERLMKSKKFMISVVYVNPENPENLETVHGSHGLDEIEMVYAGKIFVENTLKKTMSALQMVEEDIKKREGEP